MRDKERTNERVFEPWLWAKPANSVADSVAKPAYFALLSRRAGESDTVVAGEAFSSLGPDISRKQS